jgi:hypothetical protein
VKGEIVEDVGQGVGFFEIRGAMLMGGHFFQFGKHGAVGLRRVWCWETAW